MPRFDMVGEDATAPDGMAPVAILVLNVQYLPIRSENLAGVETRLFFDFSNTVLRF